MDTLAAWKCPECGETSPRDEWNHDAESFCEDCGSHGAEGCPRCFMAFDRVMQDGQLGFERVKQATLEAKP